MQRAAGFDRGCWRIICKRSECCCWRQRPPATDLDTTTQASAQKHWLRSHVVTATDATGTPPYNAASLAGGGTARQNGRRFTVTKSQIYFLDPNGMQIGWQNGAGPNGERTYLPAQLIVPARYNFNQGFIYRLKITNIPGRGGISLVSDDRGRADDPGDRCLSGSQRDPGAVHSARISTR